MIDYMIPKVYAVAARFGVPLPRLLNRLLARGDREDLRLPGKRALGQYVHPDALMHKGSIYLAVSGYPFGNELYEEPEVFSMSPEGKWTPAGRVTLPPGQRRHWHLSDPDLFEYDGRLFLQYRRCMRRTQGGSDEIYVSELKAGTDVLSGRLVLSGPKGSLLSPACVSLRGEGLALFCVDSTAHNEGRLKRYHSGEPKVGYRAEVASLSPRDALWHVDVSWIDSRLMGLFVVLVDGDANKTSLFLCESNDLGHSWHTYGQVELPHAKPRRIYRSSLLKNGDRTLLLASFETPDRRWHTRAYDVELVRDQLVFKGGEPA